MKVGGRTGGGGGGLRDGVIGVVMGKVEKGMEERNGVRAGGAVLMGE